MKVKNQIFVISGILALLVTATVAAVCFNVQTVKAQGKSDTAYGKSVIAPNAQSGTWGSQVSSAAQDDSGASTHQGLGDWRANGCKIPDKTGHEGIC